MIKKISMAAAMFVAVSTTSFAGGAMDHSDILLHHLKQEVVFISTEDFTLAMTTNRQVQPILLIVSVIMDKNHDSELCSKKILADLP